MGKETNFCGDGWDGMEMGGSKVKLQGDGSAQI